MVLRQPRPAAIRQARPALLIGSNATPACSLARRPSSGYFLMPERTSSTTRIRFLEFTFHAHSAAPSKVSPMCPTKAHVPGLYRCTEKPMGGWKSAQQSSAQDGVDGSSLPTERLRFASPSKRPYPQRATGLIFPFLCTPLCTEKSLCRRRRMESSVVANRGCSGTNCAETAPSVPSVPLWFSG
jgi:hypothetical protein